MSVRRPNIRARRLEGWERGLAVPLVQATSALEFSLAFPLIPLSIQDLGAQELGPLDRDT